MTDTIMLDEANRYIALAHQKYASALETIAQRPASREIGEQALELIEAAILLMEDVVDIMPYSQTGMKCVQLMYAQRNELREALGMEAK